MKIGEKIKWLRSKKDLRLRDLSEITGLSISFISDIENNRRNPRIDNLEKIADALGVSVDRLTGESAKSLIENRSKELNITLEEAAKKAGVPVFWLQNLDSFIPGQFGDHEIGYDWITKVAEVIGLSGSELRAALARQEIPLYDNKIKLSVEEDFKETSFEEYSFERSSPDFCMVQVPVLGTIKAGYNLLAEQQIIDYEYVHSDWVKDGEYFFLVVTGDSMIDEGIKEGYRVLVRRQDFVEQGKLAVVLINGDEGTLKRVFYQDKMVILQSSNSKIPPRLEPIENVRIQGQVMKVEWDIT